MIVFDARNPRAVTAHEQLTARLDPARLPAELTVVIGGDGFLLATVAKYGLDRTYLGLNAGHLGFLLNPIDDLAQAATQLEAGAWSARAFPVLEAEIATVDGQTRRDIAVNDVYLERSTGQTARLRLTIDGHPVVESLVADGVILATALGSTAYSFSAGGAPAHPEVPILCVTPICPHLPKLSPFILPIDAVARAEVLVPDRRPVRAVADGRAVEAVAAVTVRRAAQPVRIAWFAGHDPTSTLVHKIVSG